MPGGSCAGSCLRGGVLRMGTRSCGSEGCFHQSSRRAVCNALAQAPRSSCLQHRMRKAVSGLNPQGFRLPAHTRSSLQQCSATAAESTATHPRTRVRRNTDRVRQVDGAVCCAANAERNALIMPSPSAAASQRCAAPAHLASRAPYLAQNPPRTASERCHCQKGCGFPGRGGRRTCPERSVGSRARRLQTASVWAAFGTSSQYSSSTTGPWSASRKLAVSATAGPAPTALNAP
mmetsp:Transcript_52857/g.124857  ORF Transcript_52857/g.124857 Transcript_52857/m.124857 type:complete len:233 (-) Transcript_52857:603-1301(-)